MNAGKRENIAEVWERFFVQKDVHNRNILIEHYLPIVKYTALRIYSRLPKSVQLDDLISAGVLGLIMAIDRFDPGREVAFEAYCIGRIRGEILDDLRKKDWIPRLVRYRTEQLHKVTQKLESVLGRLPTDTELADAMQMNAEEFCNFKKDTYVTSLMSLDGYSEECKTDNEFRGTDRIINPQSPNPYYDAQKKDLKEYVTRGFSREEKLILILYYYEEMTMKEIGMTLGISESRVCQLHSFILSKLRSRLNRQLLIENMTR